MAYKINDKRCLKCGLCVTQCPEEAIVVDEKVTEPDGLILYTTLLTWISVPNVAPASPTSGGAQPRLLTRYKSRILSNQHISIRIMNLYICHSNVIIHYIRSATKSIAVGRRLLLTPCYL